MGTLGLGYIQVVAGIALFGSAGIFIRYIDLPSPAIISGQAFVTLVALFAFHLLRTPRRPLRIRCSLATVLVIAVVLALDQLCFTVGVRRTTVANIVILAYLYPVLTAILSVKFLGEQVGRWLVVALVLALAGTALVLVPAASTLDPDVLSSLLGLAVAVLISVYRILVKKVDASVATTTLAIYTTAVIAIVFSPSFLLLDAAPASRSIIILVISALLTSTAAGLLVLSGLRKVEAHRAAVLSYLEPFVAALLAWIFLAERPGPSALMGGALIVVAGYLVVRSRPGAAPAVVR